MRGSSFFLPVVKQFSYFIRLIVVIFTCVKFILLQKLLQAKTILSTMCMCNPGKEIIPKIKQNENTISSFVFFFFFIRCSLTIFC